MTYQFADVNGTRIHYQLCGTGQPLVLVHAGIAHLDMWDNQMDAFAEQYRVIRYDVRGFGKSPHGRDPYSDREDLFKLLNYLQVEQAAILGISSGGGIAVDFALIYPETVSALIPVATTLPGYEYVHLTRKIEQKGAAIDAAEEKGDFALAAELEIQFWLDGFIRKDQVDPMVRARAVEMSAHTFSMADQAAERLPPDPDAMSRLHEITAPSLIMVGDYDLPDMVSSANQLAAGIPHARQAIIHGAAHLPNMEKPAEFNRIVLDFLNQVDREP